MTLCAIVTARFRNGAISLPLPSLDSPPSEQFAMAAIKAFPRNLAEARGFEYLRAKALLAILHIQYGNTMEHRTQLGEYFVLVSNDGFSDETRWSMDLGEEEQQERRRLVSWRSYAIQLANGSSGPFTHSRSILQSPGAVSFVSESNKATSDTP